jgi:hypothetical protein
MANDARTPGKRGRLPRDLARFAPRLEDYVTGPLRVTGLPPASGVIDRCTDVSDWPMYLNDQLGDCTIAGAAHMFAAMSVYAGHPEPSFSDKEIVTAYSAVSGYVPGDPSTDNGADLQTVLEYLRGTGMTDTTGKTHKAAGYAAFGNPADEVLLAQVLETFGSVYVGVELPDSAEQEFADGQPWDWQPGSQIAGGHCIALQKRSVGGTGVLEYITWGTVQKATRGFQYHYAGPPGNANGECWAVVTQDWLTASGDSISGLDLSQLLSDLQYVPQG